MKELIPTCGTVRDQDFDLLIPFGRSFTVKVHGGFGVGVGLIPYLLHDERQHGHDTIGSSFD